MQQTNKNRKMIVLQAILHVEQIIIYFCIIGLVMALSIYIFD